MELTLNEYQEKAMSTCMDSCNNFAYMSYGLVGEVGELAGKIAKHIRKEKASINANHLEASGLTIGDAKDIVSELGDCLWYVAGIAKALDISLDDVAQANINKLADRQRRGVIDGNGDNR